MSGERIVDKPVHKLVEDSRPVAKFKRTDTTPSVRNVRAWEAINTGAITVTDFREGSDGQTIIVKGDGFTTVAHNANIKTSTGANKLLAVDRAYMFVQFSGVWIEIAP